MFGIDGSEFLFIAVVALVVIGPKDLPRVMRFVGQWVGKARAMSRHVRAGFDTMMRESELEEMQKQWDAQNAAIVAATSGSLMTATPITALPEGPLPEPPLPSEALPELHLTASEAVPPGSAAEPELPLAPVHPASVHPAS